MVASFRPVLRTYLAERFSEIKHPTEPFDGSRVLPLANVADVADAFLKLLQMPSAVVDARELEEQILYHCSEYLNSTSIETIRRATAAGNLATRLEDFLKKLYGLRYPGASVPGELSKLVKGDLVGYEGKLEYKPTDEVMVTALRDQPTSYAVIHDAYYFRNTWAHKAKSMSPVEEQRYWQSVIATYLLITARNLNLVPTVRRRVERKKHIRSGLTACIESIRSRFDAVRWRNEFYLDLNTSDGSTLERRTNGFLHDTNENLLVIAGRTGAGKSTYLERLVVEIADQALNILDAGPPDGVIVPVPLQLKRYVPDMRSYLIKKLYNEFDPHVRLGVKTRSIATWPRSLSPLELLICLDGLDEVGKEAWPRVVSEIDDLTSDFDNVKVIVTSRPHAIPDHWDQMTTTILPVPRQEVMDYFVHPERLDILADDVQVFLETRPDLVDILKDPLMLEAACRYWHQFEPVGTHAALDLESRMDALSEGPLLDHLYQTFFTHHLRRAFQKRLIELERARQLDVLAQLALSMDGDPVASFELIVEVWNRWESDEAGAKNLLEMFVDIGLLKPRDTDFAFRNETIKTYFAAVGLRSLTRKEQGITTALTFIRHATEFWRRSVKLLKEIAPFYDAQALDEHLASLAKA